MYGDAMTTVLRKKLSALLVFWVLMLVALAFLVFHDLETPFSVIVHTFQKDASTLNAISLTAEEPLPTPVASSPQPEPEIITELPLLPKGTENGKATFQKAVIVTTFVEGIPISDDDVLIAIPYEGHVKGYTTFTVSSQRARVLDFHGSIHCSYQNEHPAATLPVRLVQMAQHKDYARISLLGRSPIASFTEEVRYTDTMIYIKLTPIK